MRSCSYSVENKIDEIEYSGADSRISFKTKPNPNPTSFDFVLENIEWIKIAVVLHVEFIWIILRRAIDKWLRCNKANRIEFVFLLDILAKVGAQKNGWSLDDSIVVNNLVVSCFVHTKL